MSPEDGGRDQPGNASLSAEELFEQLKPFEPDTTDELAEEVETERGVVRQLLDKLNQEKKVTKKKPKSAPTIWIREPPVNSCSECGQGFEIKFLHPVLSSVRFCPRCGKQL